MIYFTTVIFTLLLAHIARAVPACDDAPSSEDLYDYDPTYDDFQQPLVTEYKVKWDHKYDNKYGETKKAACGHGPHGLAHRYPYYKDFPDYPYIGGAYDVKKGSPNCGKCWKLHNKKTKKSIHFTAIDDASNHGYEVSKEAYEKLGGKPGMEVEAKQVRLPQLQGK